MVTTTNKKETKRTSKGLRTYVRRMKQAARKEVWINQNIPQSRSVQPLQAPKTKEE